MKAHENPFRSTKLAELRYALAQQQLADLAQTISAEHRLCSVVGGQGTGKTTLLEDLERPLLVRGLLPVWVRLDKDSTAKERALCIEQVRSAQGGQVMLLDGAEVLTAWEWFRLLRAARKSEARLVATLHKARSLPVIFQTQSDWPTTRDFVKRLAGKHFSQLESVAKEAFEQSRGNVREVFRACFWACARQLES